MELTWSDCCLLYSSRDRLVFLYFPLFAGVSHLCYGSCKAVNFIGQGLCNFLDVAVAALKAAEAVVGWVNAAIQFVMQMFLIHG